MREKPNGGGGGEDALLFTLDNDSFFFHLKWVIKESTVTNTVGDYLVDARPGRLGWTLKSVHCSHLGFKNMCV